MLQNYKKYLIENYPSKNTLKNYLPVVEKFLAQFSFNREGIQNYIQQLEDHGLASSTINIKLSALKNYNEYLVNTKQIDSIIIIKKDRIKIQKRNTSPNKISLSMVENILIKAKETDSLRNYTIAYLIISTGIRRDECANILLSNVNLEEGKLTVIGKGKKERTVYLNDKIIAALDEYINSIFRNKESKYLFTTRKSLKMHEATINEILKPYKINPHALRHFRASYMHANGFDLRQIQTELGHANINTTVEYTHISEEELKEKINKTSI